MPDKLLTRFRELWLGYCLAHGLTETTGATYLLAVSGGMDSMVMAHLFYEYGISIAVVHCNYGLRGEDSDLDEQLVRDWCKARGITFHATKFDTRRKAEEWKKGIQETARILRYEWFEQLRQAYKYSRIVTAHHANDNMETLLINLFKGTGISGLHGITPESETVLRPLLFAEKEAITEHAREHNVPYRDDISNASDDYLRNAVRHHVVPAVKHIFPNAVQHVNDSISRFAEAEALYKKAIARERKSLLEQRGKDFYIPIRKLETREPLNTIMYELMLPFGFTSAQLPHILGLMAVSSGRYIVSHTHRIIRDRDFLVITTLPDATADLVVVEAAPCVVHAGGYSFSFTIQDKPRAIPASADEAYIDLAAVAFPLILRRWRQGDYLYPLGMNMKKKKVSRILIDAKVPLHEKEEIRILECSKRVVWIAGMRLDERFKVKEATHKILLVKRIPRS